MERVQRIINKPLPENSIYVGPGSKYQNPYEKRFDLDESLFLYRTYLDAGIKDGTIDLKPLLNKNLACWCKLDYPCHADIILERFQVDENEV